MPRLLSLRNPVTVLLDGHEVAAEHGEAVVLALVAAGHVALARSPKFHRPRGPSCLRGACDGCLARVDGVPNVMTCRVPAADGMRIETQNVVGSAQTDLLRAADWFFPHGLNHHELFATVPGAQRLLQGLARRVAGLGKLPAEAGGARAPREAARREVDALVVGAGASGMAVALELARKGRQVEVVEDDLTWGGNVRALSAVDPQPWAALSAAFARAVEARSLVLRLRTTAVGIYGDDVLVAGEAGVEVAVARTLVLATGAHDGALAFEGNDVPGVMSARAACRMLAAGVTVGERVVVAVTPGGRAFGEAYARAAPGATLVRGTPVRARGSGRVKEATVAARKEERRLACDALVIDAPRAPAYELCAQAGATLEHEARGFVVRAEGGRIRPGVFAAGEVVGTPLEPEAVRHEAETIASTA
ncbi:MAG TPA: 2Fe-2S iron-sulfur cluster-binding protein [Polyangiaceae bacterium]|jgi:sarcosine oxidase subunit alpha